MPRGWNVVQDGLLVADALAHQIAGNDASGGAATRYGERSAGPGLQTRLLLRRWSRVHCVLVVVLIGLEYSIELDAFLDGVFRRTLDVRS